MILTTNFRTLRIEHGLTQQQCAGIAGVKLRQWQRYEDGSSKMSTLRAGHFETRFNLHLKNAC